MTEQPDPARQWKEDMEEEREDTFSCGSSSSSRRRSADTQRRLNLPRVALNSVDLPYQWEEEEEEDEKEKEKEHDNPTTTTAQAAITCQSGGEGNRRRSNSSNKSSGCNVTDDARGSNLAASGQLTFHPYAPSSVEDFTSDWVLYVMQRYHENNFKEAIQGVVRFSAERSDGCSSDDDDEKRPGDGGAHSQHILSQAYKVMVDVPDPPPTGGGEADEEDSEKAADRRKVHHLFVKVPPKRTAKFERMVRRNRTLEHEVKVYSELLQDLQAFVKTRVGDAIKLKIPTFYHSYREEIPPCDEGGNVQEENHVLVIEDLATKGFRTRDWFKHKLEHEEVMLAVDELAKFHACGLAYR